MSYTVTNAIKLSVVLKEYFLQEKNWLQRCLYPTYYLNFLSCVSFSSTWISLAGVPQKDTVLLVIFQLLTLALLYRVLPAGVSWMLHCQVTSSLIKIAHVAICNFPWDSPGLAHAQGLLWDTWRRSWWGQGSVSMAFRTFYKHMCYSCLFSFFLAQNFKTTYIPSVKL